ARGVRRAAGRGRRARAGRGLRGGGARDPAPGAGMSERERIAQVVAALHLPDVEWPPTREFFAGAARGELLIPKCHGWGAWVWYPQALCPTCASREIQWRPVSGRGRIFTWVRVHRSFLPGLAQQVPYVTALVELEEDPMLRVPSMLMA